MQYLLRMLSLSALVLTAACGDDSPVTPQDDGDPPPVAPNLTPRSLRVLDVGNANSAADLLITFVKAADHAQVREYRVVATTAGTLDLTTALSLPAARYRVAETVGDSARLNLAGLLASDGTAITEGQALSIHGLAVGPNTEFPGELTTAATITLANEATVFTFAPPIASGTGGISVDEDGSILMADFVGSVYRVQPDGTQELVSTDHQTPSGNLPWGGGAFLQANYTGGSIDLVAADGSKSVWAEGLTGPVGMTRAANGDVLVVNCDINRISRIAADGTQTIFSESNRLACPNSIATDGADNFYVVNFADGAVLKFDSEANVSTLSTIEGFGNGHIIYRDGTLYVTARNALQIYRVDPAGGGALPISGTGGYGAGDGPARAATLARPNGIAISPDGRFLYWNDHLGDTQNAYSAGPSVLRRMEFARQ